MPLLPPLSPMAPRSHPSSLQSMYVAVLQRLVVCRIDVFRSVGEYLRALFASGGIIQAVPSHVVRTGAC